MQVEKELGLPPSQPHAVSDSATTNSTSTGITNGSTTPASLAAAADAASSGVIYEDAVHNSLKQRQQAETVSASPMGVY
jgi:hypothetical protein